MGSAAITYSKKPPVVRALKACICDDALYKLTMFTFLPFRAKLFRSSLLLTAARSQKYRNILLSNNVGSSLTLVCLASGQSKIPWIV